MAHKDPNSVAGFARKHGISYNYAKNIMKSNYNQELTAILIEQARRACSNLKCHRRAEYRRACNKSLLATLALD
jgi:hypothetical protein